MSRQYAALRGIAIFLVVLNHSITLSLGYVLEHNYGHPSQMAHVILVSLQSLGLLAVPTFYFISGGFQVYATRGKPIRAAYRTIAKALPHIIIPYLIWSILFYLLLFVIQGDLYTIPEYLKFILVGYPLNFVPLLIFLLLNFSTSRSSPYSMARDNAYSHRSLPSCFTNNPPSSVDWDRHSCLVYLVDDTWSPA
ncbi:Surface polysaccharide O-acyltransferase, integral membrane enzyme [Candidatus Methanophagaceae archaeon]|nr:Surface polysaccharide O-acyltransferase, integral membrane enzyme [Methanophagales archaeon]